MPTFQEQVEAFRQAQFDEVLSTWQTQGIAVDRRLRIAPEAIDHVERLADVGVRVFFKDATMRPTIILLGVIARPATE